MKYDYTIVTCGTAGHVFPALALIEGLLKMNLKVALIIDNISFNRFEKILQKDIYKNLFIVKTLPFHINYKSLFILFKNLKKTWYLIKNSNLIICFVAGLQIPTLIGLVLLNKKFILHEQDRVLNRTNSIFGFFAYKIYTSFKTVNSYNFLKKKLIWKGCPININESNIKKEEILFGKKKIISIFAGTNGAKFMDETLPQELLKIPNINEYIIYHAARKENLKKVEDFYKNNNILGKVSDFFNNFEDLYKHSDLLITRSGASTISYLNFYKKKALLIPWLASSQNHQYFNGKTIEKNNFIEVVDEKNYDDLLMKINNILANSEEENNFIADNFKIVKSHEIYKYIED